MKFVIHGALLLVLGTVTASAHLISIGIRADHTFHSADLGDNVEIGYGGRGLAIFGMLSLVDLTADPKHIKITDKDIKITSLYDS